MTIVLTVPDIKIGGGISKYVYTLANLLNSCGNIVHVITTHSSREENNRAVCNFSEGVHVHTTFAQNVILRYVKTLSLLFKLKPDIIINNYNGVVQILLPLLCLRSKVIHVIHGIVDDFYRIASINAKYVSAWIAPSKAVATQFNNYSCNRYKQRVFVIPHGVSSTPYTVNKPSDVPELTFVGVLYKHKGAHLLPGIIKEIAARKIPFHFNVVGDGVLRSQLEDALFDEIEQGIVHFTGVVPSPQVYEILSRTTIFVYPTQLDSFGLVIAEAMMCGAVPVVSRIPGVTDNIIKNEENGFLLSSDSESGFVECVVGLLENPSRLENMKALAKMTAKESFSIAKMKERYLEIIQSI